MYCHTGKLSFFVFGTTFGILIIVYSIQYSIQQYIALFFLLSSVLYMRHNDGKIIC